MTRTAFRLILATPCAIALSGCCYYSAKPLETHAASTLVNAKLDLEGLTIAVKLPPENEWEEYQERHYGTVLTDSNVVPIEVFLENRSADWDYNAKISASRLELVDGTRFDVLTGDQMVAAFRCSGWRTVPWWLLGILPGMIALADVNIANNAMARDWETKALRDLRLPVGGAPVQGVLFLRPRDADLDDLDLFSGTLLLDVTTESRSGKPGDRQLVSFAITR